MIVWYAYKTVLGLPHCENYGFDKTKVEIVRKMLGISGMVGTSLEGFIEFATEYVGLTHKQAEATWMRQRCYLIRNALNL